MILYSYKMCQPLRRGAYYVLYLEFDCRDFNISEFYSNKFGAMFFEIFIIY